MMVSVKRILLVEDSPNDAELTLEALAGGGLANQVEHVQDGQEAIDYLLQRGPFSDRPPGTPCLVLLDLKLPKVSGLEVLQAIRGDERLRTLPVVVLTSSREELDLTRCYELGANAYVVKPVDFKAFVEAVQKLGVFWALLNEPPPQLQG